MIANMAEKTHLSVILERFMDALNLSQREAAEASGMSQNTFRSALSGVNVNTGGSFRPRDATLRHVAASINAYAESKDSNFRVSFEQLLAAVSDQHDQQASEPESGLRAVPDVSASPPAGYIPWTDAEKDVVIEAYELSVPLSGLFDPAFRRLAPARRASQFEVYRRVVSQHREFRRQQEDQLRETLRDEQRGQG